MNKSQRLIELLRYVNMKKEFTAQEIANEFNISVRTVHRDLLELSDLGVYFYTEQGKNGGYRLISSRLLPPVNFTEDEAIAIFFAFQSLSDYYELPFQLDISSVSRKLYTNLPAELQNTVDRMKSTLAFKNTYRKLSNKYLKNLLQLSGSKKVVEIKYNAVSQEKKYNIIPICIYSNNGFWYVPSYDLSSNQIKHFRIDRILYLSSTENKVEDLNLSIEDCFETYKISNPVHLYVKLDKQGIRECENNQYISTSIQIASNGEQGFIDEIIDIRDIEYLGDLFLRLGKSAEVIEPVEMRQYISKKAKELLNIYSD